MQSLNKYKATISAYELDITDAEMTIQQIAAAATDRSPDILMHFVGITGPWSFDEMSQEQFEHVMTINVFGTRNVLAAVMTFFIRLWALFCFSNPCGSWQRIGLSD